jgi:hypothetical protein
MTGNSAIFSKQLSGYITVNINMPELKKDYRGENCHIVIIGTHDKLGNGEYKPVIFDDLGIVNYHEQRRCSPQTNEEVMVINGINRQGIEFVKEVLRDMAYGGRLSLTPHDISERLCDPSTC